MEDGRVVELPRACFDACPPGVAGRTRRRTLLPSREDGGQEKQSERGGADRRQGDMRAYTPSARRTFQLFREDLRRTAGWDEPRCTTTRIAVESHAPESFSMTRQLEEAAMTHAETLDLVRRWQTALDQRD